MVNGSRSVEADVALSASRGRAAALAEPTAPRATSVASAATDAAMRRERGNDEVRGVNRRMVPSGSPVVRSAVEYVRGQLTSAPGASQGVVVRRVGRGADGRSGGGS